MKEIDLLFLISSVLALNIQILTSSATNKTLPNLIFSTLKDSNQFPFITFLSPSTEELELVDGSELDILIDLTISQLLRKRILEFANIYEIPILYLDPNNFIQDYWAFCIHPKIEDQASSITSLVQHFGWLRVAILSQSDQSSIELTTFYKSNIKHAFHAYLSVGATNETLNDLVSKQLKPGGYKQYILVGQEDFIDKIATSMKINFIYDTSGVVSGSSGLWSKYNENSIIIIEQGLEMATSYIDYELLGIQNFISDICKMPKNSLSSKNIRNHLELITVNHMKAPEFSIIKKKGINKVLIGKIESGKVTLSKDFSLNQDIVDNSPPLIYSSISMNNPIGLPTATIVPYLQAGAIIASQIVNETKMKLKNFLLKVFYASCGSEFFNEALSAFCWTQSYSAIGAFYIASPVFAVTAGESLVFKNLGIKNPVIGGLDSTSELSSSVDFPYFTRIVGSIDTVAFLVNILKAIDWDSFSIIYTNSSVFQAQYKKLIVQNIKINNIESLRILPTGYNDSMFEEYKNVFQEVYRTRLRPIFILSTIDEALHIAKSFNRLGLKKGDLIGIFSYQLSTYVATQTEISLKTAFIEIFEYSLMISGLEFIGEYGSVIKNKTKKLIGEKVENTCYSFDAMMLGINAVDYLLNSGLPYENPDILLKSIRNQRFEGCSGIISIDSNSNDRRNYNLGLFQLVLNNQTHSPEDRLVAVLDKDEVAPIVKIVDYTWNHGNSSFPTNSRLDGLDCPFEEREIKKSPESRRIFYLITSMLTLYTVLVSGIIWIKLGKIKNQMINHPVPEKFGDFIVMFIILIDGLQVIGMGPNLNPLFSGIENFPEAVSINLANIVNFSKSLYWIGLFSTLIIILSCTLFFIIIIGNLAETLDIELFKVLDKLGIILIPVISDILFIPIVNISLLIFDCENSIGSKLNDSYMAIDCNTFCWENKHLTYAILTGLALACYIPISIFLRPLWQELEPDVNIRTNSIASIGKALIQLVIVVLHRTVKKTHEALLGGCFLMLIGIFTVIIYKFKPFNYQRANMWKLISNIACCWVFLLSSLYWYLKVVPYLWTCLIVIGWTGFAIFGQIYQKKHYPSLLISEKSLDISDLVKFTFSKSLKLTDITLKRMSTLHFAHNEKYDIGEEENNHAKRNNTVLDLEKADIINPNP